MSISNQYTFREMFSTDYSVKKELKKQTKNMCIYIYIYKTHIKETVSVISSDPPGKADNARFKRVT